MVRGRYTVPISGTVFGLCRARQLPVKRRQRKPSEQGHLQIGGIARSRPETVSQTQRTRRCLPIGAGIDRDRQCAQIGGRHIAIGDCDPPAPHRDLKSVQHFEPPQRGHNRAGVRNLVKNADAPAVRSSSKYHDSVIEQSMTSLTDARLRSDPLS